MYVYTEIHKSTYVLAYQNIHINWPSQKVYMNWHTQKVLINWHT